LYRLNSYISSIVIAESLGLKHIGDAIQVIGVSPLNKIVKGSLSFSDKVHSTNNTASVIGPIVSGFEDVTRIEALNPRLEFIRAINLLEERIGFANERIFSIHPSVKIHPLAVIEERVSIDEGSVIGPFVHISSGTEIGRHCDIRAGAKIGQSGFGIDVDENNTPIEFPHLGSVILGNNVRVGCNTTISKGVLGDTHIKDHVKIDDQVYIAHNCTISENTLIVSGSTVCGSVKIGRNVFVGASVNIKQHCQIGNFVTLGIGSNVISDVAARTTVVGNPARTLSKAK
jgi:acyl-[acyl carrier protein]--UDP-N-acetylglucosamine O-acyltransferase